MVDGARQLRTEGRVDEAAATVEEALRRFPDEPLAHLAMANTARHREEDPAVIRAHIDDGVALAPDDPDTLMGAAALLLALGEFDDADALMDRIADVETSRFSEPAVTASLRGALALLRGDEATAETLLREAVALDPGNAGHARLLAVLLLENDRAEEALEVVREGLGRNPSDARLETLLERIADHVTGGTTSPTRAGGGGASSATGGHAPGSSPWRRRLPDGEVLVVHGRRVGGEWRVSLEDGDEVAWGPTLGDAVVALLDLDPDEPWPDWLLALASELDR